MDTIIDEPMLLSPGRLRWACRRGMLELDILLESFLEKGYARLSMEQKLVFQQLLDFPDQELLELCLGKVQAESDELQDVIEKIRLAVKS
ncbi:MAG: succinate dehydrogenase assembly factor 2 [Gammaproteobacteria bacterium]|nr:succinate dehydrogenase assembly factor 2 [Gammaproteobacteria bacterium]